MTEGALFRTLAILALSLAAASPVVAATATDTPSTIGGSVSLRDRSVLPSNALLHVQLLDVSREQVPAVVVGETSIFAGVPRHSMPFVIPYRAASIDASHRYVVRAAVTLDGAVRFTTDAGQPVLANGAPASVAMILVPAVAGVAPSASAASVAATGHAAPAAVPTGAPHSAPLPAGVASAQTAAPLEGTRWKLVELAGVPSTVLPDVPEAYLQLDAAQKRIAAIGGCNRLMGTYVLTGNELAISAGGMTMMACPDPLGKQELTFTDALRATKNYRLSGNTLDLLDGSKVLARFVAASS